MRHLHFVLAVLLSSLSLLSMSPTTVVRAAESISAAVYLRDGGTYDLHGQTIRCAPDQEVGIHVEARLNLTVANAVVEGCKIGVLITTPAQDQPRVSISGITVNGGGTVACTVAMSIAGLRSVATDNIGGGCTWGVVVTGYENTLIRNHSNDNAEDGFLVRGKFNRLEENESRRNGNAGIRIASVIPTIEPERIIQELQDRGGGNTVRGNTALENSIDLVEAFASPFECSFPGLPNNWEGNTFDTRSPECIQ